MTLDSFRKTADAYAELGLDHVFVLAGIHPDAPRTRKPAQGTQSDPARLERIAELLALAGRIATAAGALLILDPHVGTWVETADETHFLLDNVDPGTSGSVPTPGTGPGPAPIRPNSWACAGSACSVPT